LRIWTLLIKKFCCQKLAVPFRKLIASMRGAEFVRGAPFRLGEEGGGGGGGWVGVCGC